MIVTIFPGNGKTANFTLKITNKINLAKFAFIFFLSFNICFIWCANSVTIAKHSGLVFSCFFKYIFIWESCSQVAQKMKNRKSQCMA